MRRGRPVRPVLLMCLAIAVGGAAVGGTAFVRSMPRATTEPSGGAGDSGAGNSSVGPTQVIPVVPAVTVAPLRRVVPPDALAVAGGPVDAATLREISKIEGVRDAITFDGGTVRLRGGLVDVFGVQPSTFRAWTPPPTAGADTLWTALARGEFATSVDARRDRRLTLGAAYRIEGRRSPRVRLGAVASLGLPGVDALVSKRTGERLGLVRDIGVLVNAPGADMDDLAEALQRLLGTQAQVMSLREHEASGGLPTEAGPRAKARSYLDLYKQAATSCPGLSWTVLAAIGQIESGHGRNNGPSSAGALGPMQFMPATWRAYGIDGDGDGRAEIMNPYDAVPSAARYLCASGAGRGGESLSTAIWRYNHAGWYVEDVLSLARAYARTYG